MDRPIKILGLTRYAQLGASSRLRTFQYLEALRAHGIEIEVAPLFGDDYVRALYGKTSRGGLVLKAFARRLAVLMRLGRYDAVWVEKEMLPWLPAITELALIPKSLPLITDYDDAIFHRYDQHRLPLVRQLLGDKIGKVMQRSDLVVAGNAYLADHARTAGAKRVAIIPTVVDLSRYPLRDRAPSETVTIGWIGSPSTASYLDIVKPVLADLGATQRFRAVAIGARAEQVAQSPFEPRPWSIDTEVEDLAGIDIGIMPLADTPWERGKCGYKLIQYMALGIPVIATPIGANRDIVVDGHNGFWASDAGDWRRALAALLDDAPKRRLFGDRGREMVETRYALAVQAPELARLIAETVRTTGRR